MKKRPLCPFYGFHFNGEFMKDTRGNQCALMEGNYPCQMEIDGRKPNWNICSVNTEDYREDLESIAEIQTFPREFADGKEWSGISLRDWRDYILEIRH